MCNSSATWHGVWPQATGSLVSLLRSAFLAHVLTMFGSAIFFLYVINGKMLDRSPSLQIHTEVIRQVFSAAIGLEDLDVPTMLSTEPCFILLIFANHIILFCDAFDR